MHNTLYIRTKKIKCICIQKNRDVQKNIYIETPAFCRLATFSVVLTETLQTLENFMLKFTEFLYSQNEKNQTIPQEAARDMQFWYFCSKNCYLN